jgi:predicted TIM-barrel fold metal-dependent hydrolase
MNLINIPALDHHAHNLLPLEGNDVGSFRAAFSESSDPLIVQKHVHHTLFFRRSLKDLGELLSCDPSLAVIMARRQELGLEQLTSLCFQSGKFSEIFLDDGFRASQVLPWQWHQQFLPVRRILRLEKLAEELLPAAASFTGFLEHFRSRIDPPSAEVVAFKSIAAYRTGLRISRVSPEVASSRFSRIKQQSLGAPLRLADKPMIDFLVILALEVAAKYQIPMQFHTGWGDPDLDLRLANPLHLRPLLEEKRWRAAPIVLLHGAYPFVREAGYLAAVYPQVYLDCGLTIPFLSVAGMRRTLRQLLEIAPTSKLMFSTDAHVIPELFFLGAKWGRKILAQVLEGAVADADLSAPEAERAAAGILYDNAKGLYLERR